MAAELADAHQYFVAHYFAGVAIECMLRALAGGKTKRLTAVYSLDFWANKGGLMQKTRTGKPLFTVCLARPICDGGPTSVI